MTVKFRKGLEVGPGLGLEDTNERPGGSVDQREKQLRVADGMREDRVQSMEYRQRHYFGCRVTGTGDGRSAIRCWHLASGG